MRGVDAMGPGPRGDEVKDSENQSSDLDLSSQRRGQPESDTCPVLIDAGYPEAHDLTGVSPGIGHREDMWEDDLITGPGKHLLKWLVVGMGARLGR